MLLRQSDHLHSTPSLFSHLQEDLAFVSFWERGHQLYCPGLCEVFISKYYCFYLKPSVIYFPPKINNVCRDCSSSVLKWYVWAIGAAVVLAGYIHSLKLWKCALEISASFRAYLQLSFKGLSPLFWRRAVWTTLSFCDPPMQLLFPPQCSYEVIASHSVGYSSLYRSAMLLSPHHRPWEGGAEYKSNTLFNPTGRNRENRRLLFRVSWLWSR
jgi:hypothetical protein